MVLIGTMAYISRSCNKPVEGSSGQVRGEGTVQGGICALRRGFYQETKCLHKELQRLIQMPDDVCLY